MSSALWFSSAFSSREQRSSRRSIGEDAATAVLEIATARQDRMSLRSVFHARRSEERRPLGIEALARFMPGMESWRDRDRREIADRDLRRRQHGRDVVAVDAERADPHLPGTRQAHFDRQGRCCRR
jgi:hypothetical protein